MGRLFQIYFWQGGNHFLLNDLFENFHIVLRVFVDKTLNLLLGKLGEPGSMAKSCIQIISTPSGVSL